MPQQNHIKVLEVLIEHVFYLTFDLSSLMRSGIFGPKLDPKMGPVLGPGTVPQDGLKSAGSGPR